MIKNKNEINHFLSPSLFCLTSTISRDLQAIAYNEGRFYEQGHNWRAFPDLWSSRVQGPPPKTAQQESKTNYTGTQKHPVRKNCRATLKQRKLLRKSRESNSGPLDQQAATGPLKGSKMMNSIGFAIKQLRHLTRSLDLPLDFLELLASSIEVLIHVTCGRPLTLLLLGFQSMPP